MVPVGTRVVYRPSLTRAWLDRWRTICIWNARVANLGVTDSLQMRRESVKLLRFVPERSEMRPNDRRARHPIAGFRGI